MAKKKVKDLETLLLENPNLTWDEIMDFINGEDNIKVKEDK